MMSYTRLQSLLTPAIPVISGDFRYDVMHGAGRWRGREGDVYEGKFAEGERHGVGKFVAAHGEVYEVC